MGHKEAQTQQVGSCIYAVPTGVTQLADVTHVEERKWVKAFAEHAHVPDFPLWTIFHCVIIRNHHTATASRCNLAQCSYLQEMDYID